MAVTPMIAPSRWGRDDQGRLVCEFLEPEPDGWDSEADGEWVPTERYVVRLTVDSVAVKPFVEGSG